MYKKVIAAVLAASIGVGSGSASAMLPSGGFGFPAGSGGSRGLGTPFFSREKGKIDLDLLIKNIDLNAPGSIDAADFMEGLFDSVLIRRHLNENIRNGCHGLPLTEALISFVRSETFRLVRRLGKVRGIIPLSLDDLLNINDFDTFRKMGLSGEFRAVVLMHVLSELVRNNISQFCEIEEYGKKNNINFEELFIETNMEIASFIQIFEDIIGIEDPFSEKFHDKVKELIVSIRHQNESLKTINNDEHRKVESASVAAAAIMEDFLDRELTENDLDEILGNGCSGLPATQELINEVRNEILTMVRSIGRVRSSEVLKFALLSRCEMHSRLGLVELDNLSPDEELLCSLVCLVKYIFEFISEFSCLEQKFGSQSSSKQVVYEVLKKAHGEIVSMVRKFKAVIDAKDSLRENLYAVFNELYFEMIFKDKLIAEKFEIEEAMQ